MVTSQKQIDKVPGGLKYKISWSWILFLLFILYVFSKTTPFNFDTPIMGELEGAQFAGDTSGIIERSQAGNMARRVGMFSLATVLILSLTRSRYRYQMNGPLAWMIVFYLGWILCSLMWSVETMYTLRRLVVVWLMWAGAISLAAQLSWDKMVSLCAFVTGVTLFLGIGNEIYLGTFAPANSGWRFSGLFHAVTMSWNASLFVLSMMHLIAKENRPLYRNILWMFVITGMILLFFTRTRTGVIAALVSVGFYWTLIVTTMKRVLFILGAIICVTGAYVIIGEAMGHFTESAATLGRGAEASKQVTNLTGRVPLWKYGFRFLAERPLHGYGFTTFLNAKNIDQIYKELGWAPVSMHSAYVSELMGTGFIGLGAFISVLVLSLIRAWKLARQEPQYYYAFAVIVWVIIIDLLETGLAFGMTFMTFYVMLVEAKLAFFAPEE